MLMGIEMLLIDSESNAVQAYIPANRLFRYEERLKCNSVYRLNNFMIIPSKKVYKVSDHKQGIVFTQKTSMALEPVGDHEIDEQKFRLRNYEDFASIVDTNIDLFDVIGQLRVIVGDNIHSASTMEPAPPMEGSRSSDRVFLHLELKDGQTMRIYIWGSIAALFRERWNQSEVKPVVLLITTVNPKTVGGAIALSSTSSTRLFFDTDVAETEQHLTWLGHNAQTKPKIASSSSAVTKLETVTIHEIHQFLRNETPQDASFYCVATILDILLEYGWYYISCSECNNKLEKAETSMYCNNCKEYNKIGIIRFRFEIKVCDKNEDVETFVVLDSEATKISGRRAADVLNEKMEAPRNTSYEEVYAQTPECLKHIVGKTCKFQIKLSEYNFKTSRQTISISHIIGTNINLPTKSGEECPNKVNAEFQKTTTTRKTRGNSDVSDSVEKNGSSKEKRPRLDI